MALRTCENDLGLKSFCGSCIFARSRGERAKKASVEVESLREKVESGSRAWAEGPLDFVSIDEC